METTGITRYFQPLHQLVAATEPLLELVAMVGLAVVAVAITI
jgi:hypothetical protein